MRPIQHPVQRLSPLKKWAVFFGAAVLAAVLFYPLKRLEFPLVTPQSTWGMRSFEFSGTPERSREVLAAWDVPAREAASSCLLLDFLFAPAFATALTVAGFWAGGLFFDRGYGKSGYLAAGVAWLHWPGILVDYLENAALWMQLRGTVEPPWPRIASICATIKFMLAGVQLVILLFALFVAVFRRRRALPPPIA